MIFLRVLAFLAGSFVLFAAPFLLLSDAAGQPAGGAVTVVLGALAVLVYATGYYFLALAGHRAGRSSRIRRIAASLIVFQLLAGAWVLASAHSARVLVASAPLLCLCVFLFMAFVWPGDGGRSHRPMRRRGHSPMY
jgi:hypothetical protein